MKGPRKNRQSQLPRRFPVGATYVVEGFGGSRRRFARHRALRGFAGRPTDQRFN